MEGKWLCVVVVLSVLCLETGLSKGCLEQERVALLQLKPLFINLRYSSNWTEEKGSDCCRWERVECNSTNRRVTKLSLNFPNQPSTPWYVNTSLFLPFQELRSLDLSANAFIGCVQDEGFHKLSKLRHLRSLDLGLNYFSATTLSSLSEISSLKSLSLVQMITFTESNNPDEFKWLSRLTGLETLDLSITNMKNNFLLHLSGLSSLTTLILSGNSLSETLDLQDFRNLRKLKQLDLGANRFESLRSYDGNGRQVRLINLEELDLSQNGFDNSVLGEISGFPNLKSLDLTQNQLQGSIDIKELCSLSNLETLYMSYNAVNEFVTSKEKRCLQKLKNLYLDRVYSTESISLVSLLEPFSSVKTLSLKNNPFINKTAITQGVHVMSNVENLYLDNTPLDMSFLQSIGHLMSLKILSLNNCGLNGSLPAQGWCYLKSLEEFSLSGNGVEGEIASCLGNLTSLQYLDLSYNQFTGNVASTSLTNLTKLQYLSLAYNHFQLPISFMPLANNSDLKFFFAEENMLVDDPPLTASQQTWFPKFQLQVFSLSNCQVVEEENKLRLPDFLYYQHDLRSVDLSYIKFGGIKFPNWLIKNNTKLEQLFMIDSSIEGPLSLLPSHDPNYLLRAIDMSNNKMQGQIPPNFCSFFPNLEWLFLPHNSFNGSIPLCFGGMGSLSHLDLSHNQFLGRIPEGFAMSATLELLRLSNNSLSGKMFSATYRSNVLMWLYLDGDHFDGDIPQSSPISSTVLDTLDLRNNSLSGEIPEWIWSKSYLRILAFSNNHLEGTISKGLCNMVNLYFLDLSNNNLSGTLPSCFSSTLARIQHVHLSDNKLSGPPSNTFDGSSSLVTLDLSRNNFTGEIPDWIGTLTSLSVLLLKANQFHGAFPMYLCKLYSLSILDLSQNKLSGAIPSCVSNLSLKQGTGQKSFTTTASFGFVDTLLFNMSEAYDHIRNTVKYTANGFPTSRSYLFSSAEEEVEFSTKSSSYTYKGKILDLFSGIDLSCNHLSGGIPPGLGNLSQVHSLNLSHNILTGQIPATFSKLEQVESLDLSYNNLNGRIPPQLIELNTLAVFSVAHNNLSGPLPDMKAQFGTFEQSSYEGNPLLCGPPLKNSCGTTPGDSPPAPQPPVSGAEERGFIDMGVFYISFGVSYTIILLAIASVLYINPYWRRTWFYLVEKSSTTCYLFILDSLHRLPCFRRNI